MHPTAPKQSSQALPLAPHRHMHRHVPRVSSVTPQREDVQIETLRVVRPSRHSFHTPINVSQIPPKRQGYLIHDSR